MRSTMISRCSSPMPAMMVWPESMSVRTLKVGSSCASLASAMPIFSWSALVFGSTATSMTGLGKSIDSSTTGCRSLQIVSPVIRFFRPTAAQISPARISVISSRLLACIFSRRPMRSVLRGARIQHRVAGLQRARIHADEDQLADKRVGHDLEAERSRTARCRPALRTISSSMFSGLWPIMGGMSSGLGR